VKARGGGARGHPVLGLGLGSGSGLGLGPGAGGRRLAGGGARGAGRRRRGDSNGSEPELPGTKNRRTSGVVRV
jgi:hypothetical protein